MKVEIDEEVLTKIADQTGGEYFRATDKNALAAVYEKINQLERSKVEVNNFTRYNELFAPIILLGLLLLALEFLVKFVWLRQIP